MSMHRAQKRTQKDAEVVYCKAAGMSGYDVQSLTKSVVAVLLGCLFTTAIQAEDHVVLGSGGSVSQTGTGAQSIQMIDVVGGDFASAYDGFIPLIINAAPLAQSTALSVTVGQTASGTVSASDANAADVLSYEIVTTPQHGSLTAWDTVNGTFTYSSQTDLGLETVADSFTYRVQDGLDASAVATVSITLVHEFSPTIPTFTMDSVEWLIYEQTTALSFRITADQTLTEDITVELELAETSTAGVGQDFTLGTSIVVKAGSSFVDVPFIPIDDNDVEGQEQVAISLKLIPDVQIAADSGTLSITLRDNDAPSQPLSYYIVRPNLTPTDGVYTVTEGQQLFLAVLGGSGTYTWTDSATAFSLHAGLSFQGVRDINNDGKADIGQFLVLTAHEVGTGTITFSDGSENVALSYVVEEGVSVTNPAPTVPLSTPSQTIYTTICPGTKAGLEHIRAYMSGHDATEARAAAWDGKNQRFTELPEEPEGGMSETNALFIATVADQLPNFDGNPAQFPLSLPLYPGWNFIGLPPIESGSDLVQSMALSSMTLLDELGVEVTGASRTALIGDALFTWDGFSYSTSSTLALGQGAWIKNTTANPGRMLYLNLSGGSSSADVLLTAEDAVAADQVKSAYRPMRDVGQPPSVRGNTSGSAAASTSSSGGCGFGSFAGCLALLLCGLIRLSFTSSSTRFRK